MTFSPAVEARLAKLVQNYPPGRLKGALIPMLMYIQDQTGHISKEVAEEVSQRLGVSTLEVDEVVGFYTMLRARPMGKYHLQICTNISCLLTGGEELWEHACHKLGIGHNEVLADGQISLEEVECIGACSWAPAIQVNFDFHHNVTKEKLDAIIESLRKPQ
ncbi:MAG: NAD(P)H-dependent oxidoreductase subunit E [Bryobacterales bacterium]|nr:NAD(P)H-dependent oxidoreductase subunit E [Bryobacterales bacterium]